MGELEKARLSSWKEIASFLGRDVTTAQRWERLSGLPVHRVRGAKGSSVYAFPSEISEWLKDGGGARPDGENREKESASTRLSESQEYVGHDGKRLPQDGELGGGSRSLWRRIGVPLAAATLLVVAMATYFFTEARNGPGISEVQFRGTGVTVLDAGGRLLWTYDFGRPISPVSSGEKELRVRIVKPGRTGREGVLVFAPLFMENKGDLSTDVLYFFSYDGKLLWRHRFDQMVSFGGRLYGPRWAFGAMMPDPDRAWAGGWCTVNEFPWWPSVLYHFDMQGHFIEWFENAGHIHSLGHLRTSQGNFLLAGGISNEHSSAMLAVLSEEVASGSSPSAPGSAYACSSCGTGSPHFYFVFPRSEVNPLLGGAYNETRQITVDGEGIHVFVTESINGERGATGKDWEEYDFTEKFVPISVSVSDGYWEDHRMFSAEGKIRHSVENCPERTRPRLIQEWEPQSGWRDIWVPPAGPRR